MNTKSLTKILHRLIGTNESSGKVLRNIRLCDEMSLKEFAAILKISISYLSSVEHGRRLMSAKKAYEYAEKLGYPVEEFVRLALQDEANSFMAVKGHYANVSLRVA